MILKDNYNLYDVSPPDKKLFTCKFKETDTLNVDIEKCRKQKTITYNSCFSKSGIFGKTKYKREPSRCDRILILIKREEIPWVFPKLNLISYENIILNPHFDHNSIEAVFELES